MWGRDSIIWRKDNRKDRKTAMEKTLWEIYNDTQLAELETLTADYKDFLDAGKTERSMAGARTVRIGSRGKTGVPSGTA